MTTLSNGTRTQTGNDPGKQAEYTIKRTRVLFENLEQTKGGLKEKLVPRRALSQTSASGEAQIQIPRGRIEHEEGSNGR